MVQHCIVCWSVLSIVNYCEYGTVVTMFVKSYTLRFAHA